MSRKYSAPPIAEAICALVYERRLWDLTLPGRFFEQTPIRLTRREDVEDMHFNFDTTAREMRRIESPRVKLSSPDGKTVVQFRPGVTTVSHLAPYSSWIGFRSDILACAEKLAKLLQQDKAEFGLELRYINAIPMDRTDPVIHEYLRISPKLPEGQDRDFSSYYMRIEFPKPALSGLLVVETGSGVALPPAKMNLMLDLRLATLRDKMMPSASVESWLDSAHDAIEQMFESCVTDSSRQQFGGENGSV